SMVLRSSARSPAKRCDCFVISRFDPASRYHACGRDRMSTASGNTPGLVPHNMVTTALELPGYRITRNLGVVRGIVVRSRSVLGTIGAGLQTIVGGNITLFSK